MFRLTALIFGMMGMQFAAASDNLALALINRDPSYFKSFIQGRRMAQHEAGLPPACLEACPAAKPISDATEKMSKDLGEKMADPSNLKMEEVVTLMSTAMNDMLTAMCTHKEGAMCMSTNAAKCGVEDDGSKASPEEQMTCLCEACPGMRAVYSNTMGTMMGMMMYAFSGAAEQGQETSKEEEEAMTKQMMEAMCPMVGGVECMQGAGAKCAGLLNEMSGDDSMIKLETMGDMKTQCEAMGFETALPAAESIDGTTDGSALTTLGLGSLFAIAAACLA
eukprot:gnl/TRDRNA2_/TRDRNA2_192285_c0_seq1.p1 gnl/TRDRNA2_/TRDRNA2_192285_c0~~gnl/TRDRNA2_/TRDRNA2_192285_c0_seq1.p1  ORF type:complete len:278 (+),score=55.25 gnl/TRDRNA2_/TRDRNA2_192285_c0_seq1:63-896(+)